MDVDAFSTLLLIMFFLNLFKKKLFYLFIILFLVGKVIHP